MVNHLKWLSCITSSLCVVKSVLCNVQELQLGANRLSRLDPVSLVSLTGLVYLDLRENKLGRSESSADEWVWLQLGGCGLYIQHTSGDNTADVIGETGPIEQ